MRRITPLLLIACLIFALVSPAQAERRIALVIGNAAYKEGPLRNSVNDADDMAAALRRQGFEVILRENASLAQMEAAVDEFWQRLKQGGTGLFYFAGHGLQVNGRNYLVPVDARLQAEQDAKYKCLDAGLLLGRMENAGNDLNIIILDACRNNPFARSFRSGAAGLAKMDAPQGSLIAYATAPDSVAADGTGRNGLYTEKLLKAMETPGLPLERMFKRVRDEVMSATKDKQVPWESTSLRGNFSFSGGSAALIPLAQPGGAPDQRKPSSAAKSSPRFDATDDATNFAQLARRGFGDAQSSFEAAVRTRPENADARAGLAIALLMSKREADAKYHVRRIEETGRNTPYTRVARGFMLAADGQVDDSSYQINRAQEDGADKALVQLAFATVAIKKSNMDQAKKALEAYHALVPLAEENDYARELTKKSDFAGQLEGTFLWMDSTKTTPGVDPSTTFTFLRAGEALTVTSSTGAVRNVQVEGRKIQFYWSYTVAGFFGGTVTALIVADASGDLNSIPIVVRWQINALANDPRPGVVVRQGGSAS